MNPAEWGALGGFAGTFVGMQMLPLVRRYLPRHPWGAILLTAAAGVAGVVASSLLFAPR